MKTALKSTFSLILLLLFVIACSLAIILIFAAGWLHTYRVFTGETPIAKVEVSELKQDEAGEYFEVTIQQVKGRSPLASIFNPSDDSDDNLLTPETYKLYGDELHMGGPTIRFKDFLTLFNFDLVYKLAFVRAEYTDPEKEEARNIETMPRRYDLNGGYTTWRSVYDDFRENNFRGQIMKLFINSLPQINTQGIFVGSSPQTLTLCVTEESFFFCDKEI
ncbi:MAG: hypothetical protein Kow0081_0240 [Candidatus Dojkabacteria bacterium]